MKELYNDIKYFRILKARFIIIIAIVFFNCSNDNSSEKEEIKEEDPDSSILNIVIVLADDLTANDLGCYGGVNVATPNINKLASEGMRFTNGYTSSAMCTPSRTALYTGIYPVRNGAHRNGPEGIIKPGVESIAHHLRRQGYRVGLTGKKHINPINQFAFDIVPGFTADIVGQTADYDVEQIKPFMRRDSSEPYCLIVASTLPHAPWTEGDRTQFNTGTLKLHDNWYDTPETRTRFRDYLAEVSALDKQVGDVMQSIKDLGQTDNTLVLFLSEQGGQFAGNKWTLWNQGIHSAIIARLPGVIKEGVESNQLVQYVDIIPTLFGLIGKDVPVGLEGHSFAKILTGESLEEIRDYGYAMHTNSEGGIYSIRTVFNKNYKLIWNLDYEKDYFNKYTMNSLDYESWISDYFVSDKASFLIDRYTERPEFELYNTVLDQYELNNLIKDSNYSSLVSEMKSKVQAWMIQQGDPGSSIN